MAIDPQCDRCSTELSESGALAFDPPDAFGRVIKYHLCRSCWADFMAWLTEEDDRG